jgi:phage-related protein
MDIQSIATTISVVATAVAAIISLLTWRSSLAEQTRKARLESAQLAWKLANLLHEHEVTSNALELIDGETSQVKTPQHGTYNVTTEDVRRALDPASSTTDSDIEVVPSEKDAAIRHVFDSMLYAFDQIRSATEAGLISKDVLSEATLYYCRILTTTHSFVLTYGKGAYPATVNFVKTLAK